MAVRHTIMIMAGVGLSSAAPLAYAVQDLVVSDRAAEESVLFSADRVIRDRANAPIIAEGNVRAVHGQQTLIAERIVYDQVNDTITAEGNVSIFDPDGQTFFADRFELTGDLRDGVATNFSALLDENVRMTGSTVVRRSSGVNDVNKAAFTACAICKENGDKKTPTWQVKAVRITQDKNEKTIRFRHATFHAFGVPIFYTPYLEIPDPSVKRKSGFLTPSFGNSTRTGFQAEIPYYLAISDYQDLTLTPKYFEELGTLMQTEYRFKRHNGAGTFQVGLIEPKDDPVERPNDPTGLRWHIFGAGYQEFAGNWRGEYDIDFVSDKRYLRTYDVEPERELREAYDVLQPDRLENEFSLIRETRNSTTDISTVLFQSLRLRDDNDFIADAVPHIRHEQRFDEPFLGGDIAVSGDLLYLNRPVGMDTGRAIAQATYENSYTTRNGHRLRGFAELRADHYEYLDADEGVEACRNIPGGEAAFEACRVNLPREARNSSYSSSRFLPTAGIEWSYPLVKLTSNSSFIIEPRIQAVISPEEDFSDDIYNEDSQFFVFDSVTLFDWNKATGFDQWEDGQRLNVGISGNASWDNGLVISGGIGQQFRSGNSTAFDADSGLGGSTSDIVGDLEISYKNRFSIDNRFRFDDEDGTLRRGESTLRARFGPVSGNFSYLRVETLGLGETGRRDEFLTGAVNYQVTDRWSVGGNWRENLESGETTNRSLSVRYRDDCTLFSLNYRFDNRTGDDFDLNESLTFNVEIVSF